LHPGDVHQPPRLSHALLRRRSRVSDGQLDRLAQHTAGVIDVPNGEVRRVHVVWTKGRKSPRERPQQADLQGASHRRSHRRRSFTRSHLWTGCRRRSPLLFLPSPAGGKKSQGRSRKQYR